MRESTYPSSVSVSNDFLVSLQECADTTRECCALLDKSMDNLDRGIAEFPRLQKVLSNRHLYLVLPQPTISTHLSTLSSSLAPQIDTLIKRAESLLHGQMDKVTMLEQRLEMLESARLPFDPTVASTTTTGLIPPGSTGAGDGSDSAYEEEDSLDGISAPKQSVAGVGPGGGGGLDSIPLKDMNPAQRRQVTMLRSRRKRLEDEKARLERATAAAAAAAAA